jgi:predicted acyl esterase
MRAPIPVIVAVLVAAGLAPVAASAASTQPPGGSGSWQPEPASYGMSQPVDIPVTMDDGVVISTEVVYPTDPATGARAAGTFPVLLTQNPYGTERSDPTAPGDYFVQRGYIYVASAVRGTGTSAARCPGSASGKGKMALSW